MKLDSRLCSVSSVQWRPSAGVKGGGCRGQGCWSEWGGRGAEANGRHKGWVVGGGGESKWQALAWIALVGAV